MTRIAKEFIIDFLNSSEEFGSDNPLESLKDCLNHGCIQRAIKFLEESEDKE